jgi:hypothetical protein
LIRFKEITDAVTRSSAERDISIRMSTLNVFRKETLRFETLRIREVSRIAVDYIGGDHHCGSNRDIVSSYAITHIYVKDLEN